MEKHMKKHTSARRAIASTLAALGLAVGASVVATSPASAAVFDCPSGYVCSWHGGNYDSTRYQTTGSVSTYSSTHNDKASSIANHKTGAATWYANSGYWGLSWTLSGGDAAQLGGGIYNDIFSSHIA
jgi:hypothetical protein